VPAIIGCIATLERNAMRLEHCNVRLNQWLQGFKVKASQQGITQATLASTLSDTKFLPRVIELDKKENNKYFLKTKIIRDDVEIIDGNAIVLKK
jgi:membrane-bound lytic murein transglycosylase B